MSSGNLEQLIQNGAIQINHKIILLSLLRIIFSSFGGHEKREGMGGFPSEKRDEKRIIEWFSGGQLNQARERRKVKEKIKALKKGGKVDITSKERPKYGETSAI